MDHSTPTAEQISEIAIALGFDDVSIAHLIPLHAEADRLQQWLRNGYQADMAWMAANADKRANPVLLTDEFEAKSIVVVLYNYKPAQTQESHLPQFAKYAYGTDYHEIIKGKLNELLLQIKSIAPEANGRAFTDTAPILERAWAVRAGLGWIGKNSMLISKKHGSMCFIGCLMLNLEIESNASAIRPSCGKCTRCIDSCPTQAIVSPFVVDANRCISYHTIENRGEIPLEVQSKMGGRVFGCDTCQDVCPWNTKVRGNTHTELSPREAILSYTYDNWKNIGQPDFSKIFTHSAVKRTKYQGLMRNIEIAAKNMAEPSND